MRIYKSLLKTSSARLEALYQRYWHLGLDTPEDLYGNTSAAEPYLLIALKAQQQLNHTVQLIAQSEQAGSSEHSCKTN